MPAALFTLALRAFAGICLVVILTVPVLAAPVGSVVGILGGCVIESGGNRAAAKLSSAVEVGDTIEVPDGGRLRVRMADGSVVTLAAGSRMKITAFGVTDAGQRQDAQLTLQEGLVRAQVSPVKGTPARFEVETASGVTAARSTDFFVETQPGWVQTVVLSGTVTLTSTATGAVTTLSARQGARLETSGGAATARAWPAAEITQLIARTSFPSNKPPSPPRRRAGSGDGDRSNQTDTGQGAYPPSGGYTPPPPNYPPPAYNPPPPPYVPPPAYLPPPRYYPPPGGYYPPRGGGGYYPPGGPGGNFPPRGGGDTPPRGGGDTPPRGSGYPPPARGSAPGSSGPLQ